MVTMAGLCCGLSSIRFALEGKFEMAVTLVVAAAIIDGMDGRIARFLNSTSTFGAQLDSLSDFLCFGVAPVLVTYLWKLHTLKGLGWALVLFFSVCCALRLARFNTNLSEESREPWEMQFFVGIPSPAGGMLCLMPLVSSFYAPGIADGTLLCALWIPIVAVMMASRLPTFAAKRIKVHHEWVLSIMLACTIGLVILLIEPWIMFTICGIGYCATLPLSLRRYRRLANARKTAPAPAGHPFYEEDTPYSVLLPHEE